MATPAKQRDLTAVDDIRNMLILGPGSTIKLDLISMNIQRGRDHGIPDYNTLNQAMNLPTQNFNQLNSV
jgi:peroxidase